MAIQSASSARRKYPADVDAGTIALYESVEAFTMTGVLRIGALRQAVQYICKHGIAGDVVECGVWRGGSMLAIAKTLLENQDDGRTLYLFDTFEGMTEPTSVDQDKEGTPAVEMLTGDKVSNPDWCYASLEEVRRTMGLSEYEPSRIEYVKGDVLQTIPKRAPQKIALLRLDTDWYESTYHELTHLYDRLSVGGVLIIDDYGHWQGARRAVDQFIEERKLKLFLNRVDYTGRLAIKLEA